MNYISYSNLWDFIGEFLPNYYTRNDVLRSDILFRFVNGEKVEDDDIIWIQEEFGTDWDAIKKECKELEKKFISEALDSFYEQLLKGKNLKQTIFVSQNCNAKNNTM